MIKRIAIIGPGGAGKSWLATRLGERLGLEVIHLDQHFWRPGWVEPDREEWRAQQLELLDARDAWVADGNYGGTMDLRLARADTVVFLDPHPLLALARVVRRQLWGRRHGLPPDPSRWDRNFLKFLHYVWRYRRDRRPLVLERLQGFAGDVHVLRTKKDVVRFLAAIPPVRDATSIAKADGPGDGSAPSRVPPLRRQA